MDGRNSSSSRILLVDILENPPPGKRAQPGGWPEGGELVRRVRGLARVVNTSRGRRCSEFMQKREMSFFTIYGQTSVDHCG